MGWLCGGGCEWHEDVYVFRVVGCFDSGFAVLLSLVACGVISR